MHHALRLPFRFEPELLHADLDVALREAWVQHFNQGYYEGDWSGLALRAPIGATSLYPGATGPAGEFADTPVLPRCPAFQAVLAGFLCPLKSVRLLRLKAGSVIREHADPGLGYAAGEVRIHVPVRTNPQVEFYVDQERIVMREGECWYLALENLHRVQNLGPTDRIHLVIDCLVNDWLRGVLEAANADPAARPAHAIGTAQAFAEFRAAVLGDLALQAQLRGIADPRALAAETVRLGAARGLRFGMADVIAALDAGRRAWLKRRIL